MTNYGAWIMVHMADWFWENSLLVWVQSSMRRAVMPGLSWSQVSKKPGLRFGYVAEAEEDEDGHNRGADEGGDGGSAGEEAKGPVSVAVTE